MKKQLLGGIAILVLAAGPVALLCGAVKADIIIAPQTAPSGYVCYGTSGALITTNDQNQCNDPDSHGNTAQSLTLSGTGTLLTLGSGSDLVAGSGTHTTIIDGTTGNLTTNGALTVNLGGSIDFSGTVVHGVGTPVVGTDAANKAYVDSILTGGTGTPTFSTLTVTNTSTFGGLATFNGGIKVIGNTQTTSLSVTNNATVGGTLSVTGLTTLSGGAVVSNGLKVTGGTTTDTLNVTGNQTVGGNQTVTGQSFLNGGATISNNLTVAPGTTVNMGGNRVENVGSPILGTDAANKAYVDVSLGSATTALNQRIDSVSTGLNQRIDKAFDGTAIALSLASPVFQPGQRFVLQAGWGNFQGSNGFGITAGGLLASNVFGKGSTVTLHGGVGATNSGTVGSRAALAVGF